MLYRHRPDALIIIALRGPCKTVQADASSHRPAPICQVFLIYIVLFLNRRDGRTGPLRRVGILRSRGQSSTARNLVPSYATLPRRHISRAARAAHLRIEPAAF